MEFKDILKQQRIAHGMTQEELGKLVGLQKAAIYKYENGLLINPKRSLIEKLAQVFSVSPAFMMGIEDKEVEQYYLDPETAQLAQAAANDPDMRLLLDAKRDLSPEDMKMIIDLAKRLLNRN